jgi:iron complex outermembrane receptor protein
MKKHQTIVSLILAIMKFSVLQVLLSVMVTVMALGAPGVSNGQDVLDKVISISVENEKVKTALGEIEKLVSVKFTYNPQSIPINKKISGDFKDEKLSEVLNRLLVPLNIDYELSGDYIILSKGQDVSELESSSAKEIIIVQSISGKVSDDTGNPLPGVNVIEKGTSNGTSTDVNGNYTLNVTDINSVLVFTFIGFETKEVSVGSETSVNVTLSPDTKTLEEIVVVGYGTQKKGEITSAVTSVNPDQFNKGNISNVSQLLQGKVAGLSVSRAGGNPNGEFAIRLRGISSLGANTSPLVVIDGQIGADLNSVDPNDIKSIDVLKDGSAAAIYGTRGSAGVIIVTTKSGTGAEGTTISYNGLVQAESAVDFTDHLSAQQFRELGKGTDYGANTDWYKEITRTAISHTHNLSLAGSNNSGTSYNASINFRNSEGVAIRTGFEQLNSRLNLSQTALKNRLVLNFNISTTSRDADVGFDEAFKYAAIYNPTAPVHSSDPLYDLTGGGYYEANFVDYANPVAVLEQNTRTLETKRLNVTGSAEYEIFSGLKFLVRYAQQNTNLFEEVYLPRTSFFNRSFVGVSGFARGGYNWKESTVNTNRLYENTLTYQKRLGNVSLTALAGYSYQDFLNKGLLVGGGNFITDVSGQDFFTALDFGNGRGIVDSYRNGSKLVAFFGRLNLNFNDIGYFSATVRREGSTQFGANNKWGMFPAVSAGINIDGLVDIPTVNSLKLRASYGVTGSLPVRSYLSLQTLVPAPSKFYAGNNVYIPSYRPDKNANPDLKWEKKGEFDIGLDFVLLENRLSGTFDYYERTTSDLIFEVTVPVPPNLVDKTYKNIGELKSSGVELALNFEVLNGNGLKWTTGGNFSTFNVKLTKLNDESLKGGYVGATNLGTPGQEQTEITRAREGFKIGTLWGPTYEGVNENGEYILTDRNNDGAIDRADHGEIGNGLPKFQYGWSNSFRYNNFDFSFLIRGSVGHDLINTYRAFYENANVASSYNVVSTKYFNPNVTDGQIFSSLFVENGSFLKLDNAELGYNVTLPQGGAVRSLRLFLTGQNLFLITDYTGVDPEVRFADVSRNDRGVVTTNVLAPGVDRRENWVFTRSFTFGVNLQF